MNSKSKKSGNTVQDDHNWYKDRYQHVLVHRKILVIITLASLASTLLTMVVIANLTPLKTVEPFVIQIDQKSGITQVVDPANAKELTVNEAVNDYFLTQYIRARESYAAADIVRNYTAVRIMSEPNKIYSEFTAQANPNNPESNAARLGSSGIRTVKFKSLTYIKNQLVQARVLIEEKGDTTGNSQQHKIILLGFEYVKMNLTQEERYINPLGFRVTDYRVDEDVVQK